MKRCISVLLAIALAITAFAAGNVGASAASKIKKNKGDFYLKLNKKLNDGDYKYSYKIYSFNVNSKAAKACNKKLYNSLIKNYKEDYKAYSGGYSLVHNIYGKTYTNGNILSIRQKVTGPSWWEYKVFNVNKKTGKKVTAAQLYKKFGYTKKSFIKALKKKQLSKTKKVIKGSPVIGDYAKVMLSYAGSAESRKGLQVYLDGSGNLCAIAKVNVCAGAGIYQYVFKFKK